ncbi:MAG: hypothetical protein M3O02_00920 [Acidobacteriota bacterium]|nr:hypothetical protein [Acidobacteriota bacterium]
MSLTAMITQAQIVRKVRFQGWRGTPTAEFARPDGWFLCDVWFEDGTPKVQVRNNAVGLQEVQEIGIALQAASEWIVEQMEQGRHLPQGVGR